MNYNFIINPKTNRKVSIYGKIGKKIVLNYLNKLGGAKVEEINSKSKRPSISINRLLKNYGIKTDKFPKLGDCDHSNTVYSEKEGVERCRDCLSWRSLKNRIYKIIKSNNLYIIFILLSILF